MGSSPDQKRDHARETGDAPDQRSSGEEAAQREQKQQEADAKKPARNQTQKGARDQDDGGQSGVVGRDPNSR